VRNKLAEIPAGVAQLPALTYLNLDGNAIASVPDTLSGAKTLRAGWGSVYYGRQAVIT